ncbi:hypothetical protein niasHT_022640 [Heterodera trifolii]|uniref:ABTB2/3 histone-like domain-containing protein n=1 Tax=Heterodera trifolii TaxID=157864 RepID=A0ABD2JRM7_9BILA
MIDGAKYLSAAEESKKIGQNCANATTKSNDYAFNCEENSTDAIIHRPIRINRIARHYKSSSVLAPPAASSGLSPRIPSSAVGHFSASSSAHALPRLANAIRSLLSSSSAKFSPKTAFVDAADELIYYSNAIPSAAKTFIGADGGEMAQRQNGTDAQKGGAKKQRSPSLGRDPSNYGHLSSGTEAKGRNCLWHGQPTTLEQIKALYKSVPNFAILDEAEKNAEEADRKSVVVRCRDGCAALLCPPSMAHPPPVQTQRKRLLFSKHQRQSSAHFSAGTSESSDASLGSTKCVPFQHKKCHSRAVTAEESPQSSLSSYSLKSSTSLRDEANFDEATRETGGKQKPSTDSGYRSRGGTPREKQTEEGTGGMGREKQPDKCTTDRHSLPSDHQSKTTPFHLTQCARAICPSQRHNPRLYVWINMISTDQLRATAPISLEAIALRQKANAQKEQRDQLNGTVEVLIELLVSMGIELRRLCAVLGKCTCRDIGTVTLLFLPTSLAWHAIRHAQKTSEHFVRTVADQSKRWQSLSDRSQLKHLNGGLFLRWMTDSRIGAIVDEKVSLFLAAIFDFLLSQFLLHCAPFSSESVSVSELLNSLANSLPHSRNFHLLSPPIASDGYSFNELSLIVQNSPLGQLISADDSSTEISQFGTLVGDKLRMDGESVLALHHFTSTKTAPPLEQWLRKGVLYALQRRARTIRPWDIVQVVF